MRKSIRKLTLFGLVMLFLTFENAKAHEVVRIGPGDVLAVDYDDDVTHNCSKHIHGDGYAFDFPFELMTRKGNFNRMFSTDGLSCGDAKVAALKQARGLEKKLYNVKQGDTHVKTVSGNPEAIYCYKPALDLTIGSVKNIISVEDAESILPFDECSKWVGPK